MIVDGLNEPEFDLRKAMETLPMSVDHLRRLFTRAIGSAPRAYLTQKRMEEATRLLQVLGLSVKETSQHVGFRDVSYFSRVFHKHTGKWPSEIAGALD